MKNFLVSFKRFLEAEDGLTVVEYAIAGGMVTLTIALAFTTLGETVACKIEDLSDLVSSNTPPGNC